jgi:medium-chain acyl-[acyl-carrier-protein] hydrolase
MTVASMPAPVGSSRDWLTVFEPNPSAAVRLLCFPYGGGQASFCRTWHKHLPPYVEVAGVQLPGRGRRILEPPVTRLRELIAMLGAGLQPELERPFVFYGHSLGALVSFELCRWLRRSGRPGPAHLFVSGRRAPQLASLRAPIHAAEESVFVAGVMELNGTPREALENRELRETMLPILRADFALGETYEYVDEAPLSCPITALGGTRDSDTGNGRLEAWRAQTAAGFASRRFEGDHFFIHSAKDDTLAALAHGLHRVALRQARVG